MKKWGLGGRIERVQSWAAPCVSHVFLQHTFADGVHPVGAVDLRLCLEVQDGLVVDKLKRRRSVE